MMSNWMMSCFFKVGGDGDGDNYFFKRNIN